MIHADGLRYPMYATGGSRMLMAVFTVLKKKERANDSNQES